MTLKLILWLNILNLCVEIHSSDLFIFENVPSSDKLKVMSHLTISKSNFERCTLEVSTTFIGFCWAATPAFIPKVVSI